MSSKARPGSCWSSCYPVTEIRCCRKQVWARFRFSQPCCCDLTAYRLVKLPTFRANLDYLTLKALRSLETPVNISRHGMTIHKYWIFKIFNYSVYCTSLRCLRFAFVFPIRPNPVQGWYALPLVYHGWSWPERGVSVWRCWVVVSSPVWSPYGFIFAFPLIILIRNFSPPTCEYFIMNLLPRRQLRFSMSPVEVNPQCLGMCLLTAGNDVTLQ